MPEKTQKYFRRVKEKKPPPPRKRKCLVWRCCGSKGLLTSSEEKFIFQAKPVKMRVDWQIGDMLEEFMVAITEL
ncbi:uncharacterized protein G2W53_007849 [Senna tora]|uniref:Uncharacterized protein n=1 Tax=Senna tora TaxID=362788 RepID=A0A834X7R1_9FABA|nr:uncharacterized protein G2W53_007849 [Senna tora]